MNKNITIILVFILFFLLNGFTQEVQYYPYWTKSKTEQRIIEQESFKKNGVIALDSLAVEKIRLFLINEKEILSTNIIYDPFLYRIKRIISDSLDNFGIYRIRFSSSHAQVYVFFKKGDKIDFLDNYKMYRENRLVRRVLRFINKYEDEFTEEGQIEIWKNLSEVFRERKYFRDTFKN